MGKGKNNGWALASLITGVLAFILPFLGLILAITAIITGYVGQKRIKQRWMAIIGIVLGAIVIILYILGIIFGGISAILGIVGL